MNVLVVWDNAPDEILLIVLKVENKLAKKLRSWHGHYINGDAPENIQNEIGKFFYTDDWQFKFNEEIVKGPIENQNFDLIIKCGFVT